MTKRHDRDITGEHCGKRKVGIYAPRYYGEFRCIADKCRHSCCTDWEICIDQKTHEKYKALPGIMATVEDGADGPCFVLREDGRCPHLNTDGLCEIILNHGEEYLSEICRNHPRFFNRVNGRIEAGVGLACEEACRLILDDQHPFELVKAEEIVDDPEPVRGGFDALPHRDRMIALIEHGASHDQTSAALTEQYDLPKLDLATWADRYLSLEILDEQWANDLSALREPLVLSAEREYGKYYDRLLKYFIYRHVSVARSENDMRARLAFCIMSVAVIKALFERGLAHCHSSADGKASLIEWARRYSSEIEYSDENADELIFALTALMRK